MNSRSQKTTESKGHAARWEEMFERLVHFKKKYGHCHVPNQYKEDRRLGNWVATQRRQYKSSRYDSRNSTDEKVKRLREIGFDFSPKDPNYVSWESRFNEYVLYVNKHGHTEIPYTFEGNDGLSLWVSTQRQEYKLRKKGFSSHLTDERVDLLTKVGFLWEPKKEPKTAPKPATTAVLAPNESIRLSPNMEGVVSVLQQCINTLKAQQEVEHNQQKAAQEAAKQHQKKKQVQAHRQQAQLISSILGASVPNSNNSGIDTLADPCLRMAIPTQHSVGQPLALPQPHELTNSNIQNNGKSELSTLQQLLAQALTRSGSINGNGFDAILQDGGILSKVQLAQSASMPPSAANSHATLNPCIPAASNLPFAVNPSHAINISSILNSATNHHATGNLPLNLALSHTAATAHRQFGSTTSSLPFSLNETSIHSLPSTNSLPSSIDDSAVSQGSLPLSQVYDNLLQTNSRSQCGISSDNSENEGKDDDGSCGKPDSILSSKAEGNEPESVRSCNTGGVRSRKRRSITSNTVSNKRLDILE